MMLLRAGALAVAAVAVLGTLASLNSQRPNETATLRVQLAKRLFLRDEPIELELIFTNQGLAEVTVVANDTKIEIEPKAGLDAVAKRDWRSSGPGVRGGFRVAPGRSVTLRDYLQRLVESPAPGDYRLPFKARLDYYTNHETKKGVLKAVDAQGELRFTVGARDDTKLAVMLDGYLKSALQADGHDARVALSLVRNPIIVPYLVKVIESGVAPSWVVATLLPYEQVELAREAIEDALDSDRYTIEAIDVLR